MTVLNLTEARIRDLELSSGIWRDEQAKGLMVSRHKRFLRRVAKNLTSVTVTDDDRKSSIEHEIQP